MTAIEAHAPPFVERIGANWAGGDARVTAKVGDMGGAPPGGRYDFIWCAGGALYFLGVPPQGGLAAWRDVLAPGGGAVAFSELTLFTDDPAPEVLAYRDEYPDFAGGLDTLKARIDAAGGYDLLGGLQKISDAAWEAYFQPPLDARAAALRAGADAQMRAVLDEHDAEAALWRRYRDQFGYALAVVTPR